MEKLTLSLLEELKSFRSRLFEIDLDEPCSLEELKVILDDYHDNHFEVFCEEYLIAGFDLALVRNRICKAKKMFRFEFQKKILLFFS